MKQKRRTGKYVKRQSSGWLKGLLLAVLLGSAAAAAVILLNFAGARNTYKELSEEVRFAPTQGTESNLPPETSTAKQPGGGPEETTLPPETEPRMLPQYQPLYEKNPDFFGWVKIEDTKVDYPVMYAPQELEKYLHHDFNGNYYYGGTPYLDVRCTPDSDNLLIYGHNMPDGSMFKGIMKYEQKNYWQEHPTVIFDTLYAEGEYAVLAAFYDRVYYSDENCFKFYNVIDLNTEEDYRDAISSFKAKSIYDTGLNPEFGTRLITLVTCAYHTENGRFVLVAAQKQ